MSYTTVKAGLHTRLQTISDLKVKLKYEPNTIQDAPAIYSILDSFTREIVGQIVVMRYRTLHRLWVKWQDNEQAEVQLDSFINAIPAAIDADPHLGASLPNGMAMTTDGKAEWREIGGILYRTVDFFSEAVEKGPYQGSI